MLPNALETLAAIARAAADPVDPTAALDQVARIVARTLNAPLCKVLRLSPDNGELILCAGVGWRADYIGHAVVSAGPETQAGYTLSVDETVMVTDVQRTKRFRPGMMLTLHSVTSGMSTPISTNGRPIGVISVHTVERRLFTSAEAAFLEGAAAHVGPALRRVTKSGSHGLE